MNDPLRAYLDEQATELDESLRQALSITNGDAMSKLTRLPNATVPSCSLGLTS